MKSEGPTETTRELPEISVEADLAVVGGGLAGTCCAIMAARLGLKTVLVQDRPVLGGNASSEIRLWILGATVHMGISNRWAREGGVVNELMMENLWRNPEGNALVFDTILLEKCREEENLTLLLNTAAFEVEKSGPGTVSAVRAFCSQDQNRYRISAPLFCDSSGDGVLGFLAGAAFRMGAEARDEFGEAFAPTGEFGYLLGHSIYFYTKDAGRPVRFHAPSFALKDVEKLVPRYKKFNTREQGCKLWWIEHGGRMDTVHETEAIKWTLWEVVYGVWDYIKNSGKFPEADTLTLEWVGHIPGKRESRRFEGDYIMTQRDVISREPHEDDVAHGGWSIDLHPADGVFAETAGSHHLYPKGVYPIPFRSYYSRNIRNLFLAGRIISASHVAFGSTRVMATCALGGQAVAAGAAVCRERNILPGDIVPGGHIGEVQKKLLREGHDVPRVHMPDPADLALSAEITVSSTYEVTELAPGPDWLDLGKDLAQMIPLPEGPVPSVTLNVDAEEATEFVAAFWTTGDPWHHAPDLLLGETRMSLEPGLQEIVAGIDVAMPRAGFAYLILSASDKVRVRTSDALVTGFLLRRYQGKFEQEAIGGETFKVYQAQRRPAAQNLALRFDNPVPVYGAVNLKNGRLRPSDNPNCWIADPDDPDPTVTLDWRQPRSIKEVILFFDGDFDHPMETVLWGHPERVPPYMVRSYDLLDGDGEVVAEGRDVHLSRMLHRFSEPLKTSSLKLRILETWGAPAAVFEIRCYS